MRLVNGITIAYDDVGEGDNVLMLVHGHPFDRTMWRPQIAWLSELSHRVRARFERVENSEGSSSVDVEHEQGQSISVATRFEYEHEDEDEREDGAMSAWRVIAPDLRGYGKSTIVPGETTLDIFARDIAGLLDGLGVGEVVIGGLSMGGQIVMEFCRLYPERVRGVLLAATICRAETQEGKQQRAAMADRLLREGMEPYAEEVLPKMIAPANLTALPGVAEHVSGMMRAASPMGAAAAIRGRAERPDYTETLGSVDVPALVVVGDHDAFTTRADAEQLAGLIKGSELVWLEGVGHMPNLECETEFNGALERLLRRCRGK